MKFKRGDRVSGGYDGTVIEIGIIPDSCEHVASRGQPGYLVYWDWIPESGVAGDVLTLEMTHGMELAFQWSTEDQLAAAVGEGGGK